MRIWHATSVFTPPLVLGLLLTGIVGVSAAPTAAHASATPAPYPLTTKLHVSNESRMVYANGHLFVSEGHDGSDVRVYSPTGTLLHTITGEPGAAGMVVSSDGTTVYVAQSAADKISAIDATTFAHTEFAVDSCPTSLALAAGRLFYAFGCGPGSGGVSNIDPTSGGTPVSNLTGLYDAPLIAGDGTTVAVVQVGLEPASEVTYTASTAGALTEEAAISVGAPPSGVTVGAGGSTMVTSGGAGDYLTSYATTTLTQKAQLTTGSRPITVAMSPDGKHVVGGLDGANDLVNLYAGTKSAPVWQRFGATASTRTWTAGVDDQVLPDSLAFSTDGSQIYALVTPSSGAGVHLFASSIAASPTTMHVMVKSTTSARPVTASATLSGRGPVGFTGKSRGATTSLGSATTNSHGVATLTFQSSYNGSVRAVYDGSPSNYPAIAKQSYRVASVTRLSLSGAYATRHGVTMFHRQGDVRILGAVSPAVNGRRVTGAVQYRQAGKWRSIGTLVAHLNKSGHVKLRLPFSVSHKPERITMTCAGDSLNAKSNAVSPTFEVT